MPASYRQIHKDSASGFRRKDHSSNQKLGTAGRLCAQSTCCCMAPWTFHSVQSEPRTCIGTELSDQMKLSTPSIPLESDPNLFQRWRTAVNQLQHKLVFIKAIDLHQFSSPHFAVRLGLMPSRNLAAHDVTKAFELRPTSIRAKT